MKHLEVGENDYSDFQRLYIYQYHSDNRIFHKKGH
jgi:hypothetical protein